MPMGLEIRRRLHGSKGPTDKKARSEEDHVLEVRKLEKATYSFSNLDIQGKRLFLLHFELEAKEGSDLDKELNKPKEEPSPEKPPDGEKDTSEDGPQD